MAKKTNKKIKEYSDEIKKSMQDNLAIISGNMIAQIMKNFRNSTNAQKINAIKDISPTGLQYYKKELLIILAVMASESLKDARLEIPRAKKVKLMENENRLLFGEFDLLPASIRKKLKSSADLLIGTQIADIEKNLYFQYQTSLRNGVTEKTIQAEMVAVSDAYITGVAVNSGAGVISAQVVNEARNAFFFQKDTLEEIDAFQFMNESPVSPICQELAGTIFSKNDPDAFRFTPPLHFNCKSWIKPILVGKLKNRKIEKLNPSKEAKNSIQFTENCC